MGVGREASHLVPEKNNLLKSLNQEKPEGLTEEDQSELNGTLIYGCKIPNWKTLAQDRRGWKEKLVEKAKTL